MSISTKIAEHDGMFLTSPSFSTIEAYSGTHSWQLTSGYIEIPVNAGDVLEVMVKTLDTPYFPSESPQGL